MINVAYEKILDEKDAVKAEADNSVLDEAKKLVYGDRERDYDHPINDFSRTAGVLTALGYRGPEGRDITPADIPMIQIAVKLSREMHRVKRDNLVDICGYAETRRRVLDYKEETR